MKEKHITLFLSSVLLLSLSGCAKLVRLSEVGNLPHLSGIQNPHANPRYAKVTMPMPRNVVPKRHEGSLWSAGARSFFKDQRAHDVGDILTIQINFSDQADFKNETKRNRTSTDNIAVNNLMGYEQYFKDIFPSSVNPASFVNLSSSPQHDGKGEIKRTDTLTTELAATVIQILPNGNFVISGRQEIRVNAEVRELLIAGIVRPQDILSDNTVSYEKIAEARISYGGRGELSDIQQIPWGQEVIDTVSPF